MPRRSTQGSGNPETGAIGLMEPGSASSPVEVRSGATVSPEMVNVFEQAVSPGAAPGLRLVRLGDRPSGEAIALSILAWIRNVAYDKDVWIDLYVLGPGGVLHAETIPLDYQEPAEGGGDFFAAGAAVPAPKAGPEDSSMGTLQFRVYCEMSGQLFTDGILHSHRIEATPVGQTTKPAPASTTTATPGAEPAAPAATAAKTTAPKAAAPRATAAKASAPKATAAKTSAPKAAKAPKRSSEDKPAAASKPRKPKTPKA
ncbi:MAG: hypothetical protein E6G66_01770 [Actinobacteria bacterium]|nr:MAG: hypothetical protein E6G66_01770 [Actinomycetota bacterium]